MLIVISDLEGNRVPQVDFELGAVVKHKLYHYRGVVVAYDMQCAAGDKWYLGNETQPPREQPWYHVLVNESGGLSTYVAQSNLECDVSGQPIDHPQIGSYFSELKEGAYVAQQGKSGHHR
ncbi:MAG: hypothetical protein ABS34_03510 [Opitutaceae bacterium BACL24 MAG-120322-bin51]|jgi:heat shock protein HspQ|nr:MAG: hypothetical protein ABS34_03510 [Opitutaceae bacterium BACL24 MAG-120322-bin51]